MKIFSVTIDEKLVSWKKWRKIQRYETCLREIIWRWV